MAARASYLILFIVYLALWTCQLVACHLTHSLIILTDSYVNFYKLLEVILGLVHLSTHKRIANAKGETEQSASRLFGYMCTYKFKRLPVLGSFVNGLFLAGLLLSAAIEGIQTCLHVGHSQAAGERSILLQHPITYPAILVGFAFVGLVMQYALNRAHTLRDQELELAATQFDAEQPKEQLELDVTKLDALKGNQLELNNDKRRVSDGDTSQISLKSIKNLSDIEPIKVDAKLDSVLPDGLDCKPVHGGPCSTVHYCTSPVALTTCATIVYFINDELVTEISDAVLATSVVILLFFASYPLMKASGRILLQTAPPGLDVDHLRASLKSVSPLIIEVKSLHLWTLTGSADFVSTCEIVLDQRSVNRARKLHELLSQLEAKAHEKGVEQITIQPVFMSPDREEST